jgi:hypothetical protein
MPPASPITPETTEVPTETAASQSQVETSIASSGGGRSDYIELPRDLLV